MSLITKLVSIVSKPFVVGQPHITAKIFTMPSRSMLSDMGIIVTGGGSGVGFAMAEKFVAEGARVLIAGRHADLLRQASDRIHCDYAILDVTKTDTFEMFLLKAKQRIGRIDMLVNNAGISLHEPTFFDVSIEGFDKQFSTNFRGPFFLTQKFIQCLIDEKRKGSVLFISSETGDTADCRPYGYTKAAINSMVQGLAHLFKQKGIRINAIAPGITASDMTGVCKDGNLAAGNYASGRYYLPEEIAEVAAFLLSPAASCISGQIITCNNAQTVNARWKS